MAWSDLNRAYADSKHVARANLLARQTARPDSLLIAGTMSVEFVKFEISSSMTCETYDF